MNYSFINKLLQHGVHETSKCVYTVLRLSLLKVKNTVENTSAKCFNKCMQESVETFED